MPKNSTSKVQPLDQGIIRSFKNFYTNFFQREILAANTTREEFIKSFKLSESITLIVRSWECVTNECILNCFEKAFINFEKPKDIIENDIECNLQRISDNEKHTEFEQEESNFPICYQQDYIEDTYQEDNFSQEKEESE